MQSMYYIGLDVHKKSRSPRPSKHRRRDPLGSMAPPVSGACVQVALPAAVPGRLARHQRLRLCDDELYRRAVTAIPGQSDFPLHPGPLRGAGAHAVARDQRLQASTAERRSDTVGR